MVMCNYYGEVATYNEVLVTEGIFIDHKGTSPNIIIGTNDTNINSLPSDLIAKYQLTTPQFIPLPHDQQIKLRTFANKTNISFACEIEGTIKAQIPKSLGATVNTHTEQINNLNKELDRVKKLEESTVSTVTTESDFTTVEATSNGYFEDVKLEGKTLVNLVQNAKEYTLTRESVESGFAQVACDTYILDKNKDYTAIYIQISREGNTPKFSINNAETGNADYYNIALFDTSTTGYEVVIKKINRSYNWQTMRFYYDSEYIGTTKFKLLLLEGDHTQNPPSYFEGLKSVGQSASEDGVDEISIKSVNNGNMIDLDNITEGYYFSDAGKPISNTNSFYCNYYIDVTNSKGLYFNVSDGSKQIIRVSWYNQDKSIINTAEYGTSTLITIPTDAKYARLSLYNRLDIKEQLYVGYADSYNNLPYQSDKKRLLYYNEETQAWEKPILREGDSIEKHANGKYYYHQRSGEVVLNGSEGWIGNYSFENTGRWVCTIPNIKENSPLVCDKFINKVNHGDGIESIFVPNPNKLYLTLSNDKGDPNIWLQANNVTVVYQLAQEKVYECTNIDLITYANETNYVVESGVLSPRTTLKVHSNISNVVSLLQKKVSLLESNVKASQEVQDMMILETDMRMLDIELALMEFIPMTLNLGGSNMLRSATYFNFLKNHIINETYEKEYLENVMNKYLATGRINQDEYNELYKMLYPPVYDIELPIEY